MTIKGKLCKETWWAVKVEDPESPFGFRQVLVDADSALEANEMMSDHKVVGMDLVKIEIMRKVEA